MASRVCPGCGALNGENEERCYRCGRRKPGALGKLLSSLPTHRPFVARGLALVCLVIFGLMVATDGRFPVAPELGFGDSFSAGTLVRFGALFLPLVDVQPWRVLSAVFVHASMLHVGLNLWALMSLSTALEERFGAARAFLMFVVTGIFGFIVSTWWGVMFTVGASGGIFGLLGAQIGVLITRKHPGWKDALIQQLIFAAILGLALRVNTAAHLGGFAAGIVLGMLFEKERQRPASTAILAGLAVLAAVASVASLALALTSSFT